MIGNVTSEILKALVERVFVIEDITEGTTQQNFIVRYRGHLLNEDTVAAYDQLAESLKPYQITPLFRWEEQRQAIHLVAGIPQPKPSNPWINLLLFVLTLVSVMATGGIYAAHGVAFVDGFTLAAMLQLLESGLPYAVSLLAILGAHEFGHYLIGRYHKANLSLPYFLPFPPLFGLSLFGTLGAFINMKSIPKNRRVLLDIGLAGPLAGLVVAIPVLLWGLSHSTLEPIATALAPGQGIQMEGNSLLYLLLKFTVFKQLLPHPVSYGEVAPVIYWVRYFFSGQPLPFGAMDVSLNMVAWAGWAGLLVTSLNLIPAGQLDGGHVLYTLFGVKTARRVYPFILVGLVLLGLVWPGWWLWAVLILMFGRVYAEPLDQITPLDSRRKLLAVVALVVFILVFIPVPLTLIGGI
jgi:membrane-associated protease RseP (regulator of RpoE activity)